MPMKYKKGDRKDGYSSYGKGLPGSKSAKSYGANVKTTSLPHGGGRKKRGSKTASSMY